VLLSEISGSSVLHALQHSGVTTVFMPPTLIGMVIAAGEGKKYRFPTLKHLIYGGAPMPAEQIRRAQEFFGPVIGVTYGQTEAPQIVSFMTGEQMSHPDCAGSVGKPSILSDFAIMAADGALLAPGDTGEIVVRGDMIMSGYLEQPEKTSETIVNGWLHTGDLGYVDERGFLFLRGRQREVIISGGFNVYPIDVESEMSAHPSVQECAVYGMLNEKWGEAVTAAVVLKPGAVINSDALIAFAKRQLGSVKAPKHIHILDDLPRTAVGKVDKEALKKRTKTETGI
jgi:fatty-acyl-CoA synthase